MAETKEPAPESVGKPPTAPADAPSPATAGRMKSCHVCRAVLPLDTGFFRDKRAKDGRRSDCRSCNGKAGSVRRERNREKIRAYDRAYRQAVPLEKKRAWFKAQQKRRQPKRTIAQRQRRALHPERSRANHLVRKAVKDGLLVRPRACLKCGGGGRIEASHSDYSRPYDIEWLCVQCHATKDDRPGFGELA